MQEYTVPQVWYYKFLKNGSPTQCRVTAFNEKDAKTAFWRDREGQEIEITEVEFHYQDEM